MSDSTHPVTVPARRRSRRKLGWVLLLAVPALAFGVWRATRSGEKPVDPTLVVTAARAPLAVEVVDVGRIEAVDTVELASRVPGRVLEVLVDEGDRVKAGQLLVRLDGREAKRELSRAGAELARAKARRAFARSEAKRKGRGAAQGIVSAVDRQTAEQEAKLAGLDASLAAVAVRQARDQLKDTELVAPITGTVTRRSIEPGEMVKPGVQSSFESVALLTIADLSRLVVKTELNQIDVAKVKLGQRVKLSLDALPGETFAARVTKIAPASVRPAGKDLDVFPVEAELITADARIKPGMTADVRISIEDKPSVVALPLESVRRDGKQTFVTRLVGDKEHEHTERVTVVLGSENDHQVEIVSGVGEGDRVVLDPPSADENQTKI